MCIRGKICFIDTDLTPQLRSDPKQTQNSTSLSISVWSMCETVRGVRIEKPLP